MASVEIKELINHCDFKTSYYIDRFKYIYKERDYKLIICKYSFNYVPLLTQ